MSTTLYEKFVLLVKNSNVIKKCINLDKQACREDPRYITMVSADKEDLVPDLLSFEMCSHVPRSSPSELFPTAHTVEHVNSRTRDANACGMPSLAMPSPPIIIVSGPVAMTGANATPLGPQNQSIHPADPLTAPVNWADVLATTAVSCSSRPTCPVTHHTSLYS